MSGSEYQKEQSSYSRACCGLGRLPTVSLSSTGLPLRSSLRVATEPGLSAATTLSMAEGLGTALLLTSTRTSPGAHARTVRRAAAHDTGDQHTCASASLYESTISGERSRGSTPIQPRVTSPVWIISSITWRARLTGIAKPMPMLPPLRE